MSGGKKLLAKKSNLILIVVILFVIVFIIMEFKLQFVHQEHGESNPVRPKPIDPVQQEQQPIILTPSTEPILENPPQNSKFAYITLLSGLNPSFTHRGFLYNTLIMKKMLEKLGSKADFIVMVGYLIDPTRGNNQKDLYISELNLLKKNNIIIYELPRYLSSNKYSLNFAEMALLKVTPFLLTQYEKIQYFDGDIMPVKNMDCFFNLQQNIYTIGAVSPLNSGWFLIHPNLKIYNFFQQKAIWRLTRDWDKVNGWGHPFPPKVFYTRGKHKEITLWDFNGADMDQGLFLYFFAYFYGNLLLIDTELKEVNYYEKGIYSDQLLSLFAKQQVTAAAQEREGQAFGTGRHEGEEGEEGEKKESIEEALLKEQQNHPLSSSPYVTVSLHDAIQVCDGPDKNPNNFFVHFTGKSKPWIVEKKPEEMEKKKKNYNVKKWMKELDDLHLPFINSTIVYDLNLGAPLGFFNANFPKGGYKQHKEEGEEGGGEEAEEEEKKSQ